MIKLLLSEMQKGAFFFQSQFFLQQGFGTVRNFLFESKIVLKKKYYYRNMSSS